MFEVTSSIFEETALESTRLVLLLGRLTRYCSAGEDDIAGTAGVAGAGNAADRDKVETEGGAAMGLGLGRSLQLIAGSLTTGTLD